MFAAKVEQRKEYVRIMNDPAYREKLGLRTDTSIAKHLGISVNCLVRWKRMLNKVAVDKEKGFDVRGFLQDNKEAIAKNLMRVIKESKSPVGVELALSQLGELTDRVQGNAGYSNNEVMADADLFIRHIREKMSECGVCPVCGSMQREYKALMNGN